MKLITTLTIPSCFIETLKNGTKEHLILSWEDEKRIFPLPYTSNREIKIILKKEETGKEACRIKLSEDNRNLIAIDSDGLISIAYTGTFNFSIEESDLLRLLKGDNFKTKQELVEFYIQYFRKKKQLYQDKYFSGILFTWGSFYQKLHKIRDMEFEDIVKKYAKK